MARSPRHRSSASSVSQILSDAEDSFAALLRHARSLQHAESVLAGQLEPETVAQFQVAAMREDRIVLLTPSAAWATRLRMQAQSMLGILQTSGYGHIRHIDIRVAPLVREPVEEKTAKTKSPAAELAFSLMSRLSNESNGNSNP